MSILPHRPGYSQERVLKEKRAELLKISRLGSYLGSDIVRETHEGVNTGRLSQDYSEFWAVVENDVERFIDPDVIGSKRYAANEVVPYFAGRMKNVISDEQELVKYIQGEVVNARQVIGEIPQNPNLEASQFERVLGFVVNIQQAYFQAAPDSMMIARAGNSRLRF